ncbi:CFI-box-CTERM domain-containing protein [Taibaiella koreensis]|uniref:CFI-box-CTERM domain-containing protein n=1 Tax=Taibaiella koreensis TaxID=1268548 RepID=UPI0013C2F4B3|nr:CFI-box-CTERM domain-containing protein [Taibaiella koreensis]
MNPPVKIICPYCYSPDLSMYLEGLSSSAAGAMTMPSGNVDNNNMELKCNACGHVFKPGQGKLSQEAGNWSASTPQSRPAVSGGDDAYVLSMVNTQGKLAAVKYCYDTYGWGLKESKEYVDRIATPHNASFQAATPADENGPDPGAVATILQNQGLLQAIKYVTTATGWNLQQGKAYVDRLMKERNIAAKKACFVATACYGDEDAPEVVRLRRYRDEVLSWSVTGRVFIKTYYLLSPPMAAWIARSAHRKAWVRQYLLSPLLSRLDKH